MSLTSIKTLNMKTFKDLKESLDLSDNYQYELFFDRGRTFSSYSWV